MDLPHLLVRHLDELTEALEVPGADLQAMLTVLIDDLTSAVPSFLGLSVTIMTTSGPVTIASIDQLHHRQVGASLQLPLHLMVQAGQGSTALFFAGRAGAFAELAGTTRRAFDLDGQVAVDQHLTGADTPLVTSFGLDEATEINRAIGVLIGRGQPPDEARLTLAGLAAEQGISLAAAAHRLLGSLSSPTP